MMTPRERFLCALRGETPDVVPWGEMQIEKGLRETLSREFEPGFCLDEQLGLSHVLCMGPYYPPGFIEKRGDVRVGLLRERKDLERMVFPDPTDDAFYAAARKTLESAPPGLAVGVATDPGAGCAFQSMGFEGFSYALADDPEFVAEVFRRYGEWSAEVHARLCRMGFDFIWAGGDIAYKTAPFFSPRVFREIILPALRPAAEAITLPWIYHSDGDLTPILDDLLSLGMNALHPFETGAMDMAAVKKRYGKRLCVVGNLDMDLLIRGTPEQNAAETKRLLREFAPGGGYIFSSSNTLSYGVRAENVLAVSRVVRGQQ